MADRLKIYRVEAASSRDVVSQVLTTQCLTKVLKPATFEHGLRHGKLNAYTYRAGEIILPRRDIQEWLRWTSKTALLMIELPDSTLEAVAQATGTHQIEIQGTPHLHDKRVAALIQAAEHEFASGFLSGGLYLDGIGQALAAAITQAHGVLRRPLQTSSSALAPAHLRRVTDYIHAELHKDITVHQLAATVNLSPAYFSQMFHRSTGHAPHQFVLRARIQRAKEMLLTSDRKIIDIAIACGFETAQHFARVFQRLCKTTPTSYRRQGHL